MSFCTHMYAQSARKRIKHCLCMCLLPAFLPNPCSVTFFLSGCGYVLVSKNGVQSMARYCMNLHASCTWNRPFVTPWFKPRQVQKEYHAISSKGCTHEKGWRYCFQKRHLEVDIINIQSYMSFLASLIHVVVSPNPRKVEFITLWHGNFVKTDKSIPVYAHTSKALVQRRGRVGVFLQKQSCEVMYGMESLMETVLPCIVFSP